jgi:hypothetical protein
MKAHSSKCFPCSRRVLLNEKLNVHEISYKARTFLKPLLFHLKQDLQAAFLNGRASKACQGMPQLIIDWYLFHSSPSIDLALSV